MALNVSPLYTHLINLLQQSAGSSLNNAKKTSSKTISSDSMTMSNQYCQFQSGNNSASKQNNNQNKKNEKDKTQEEEVNRRIQELNFL